MCCSHKNAVKASAGHAEHIKEARRSKCKRRPSLSSMSSSSSSSDSDADNDRSSTTLSHSRVRRSKLDHSSISSSTVKRSKVLNSTLSNVKRSKWAKIGASTVTDVRSIKRSELQSAHVQDVGYLKKMAIERSEVVDCHKLKRGKVTDCVLKHVVLGQSELEKCEVVDCVVYKSTFKGMYLENGIWKNGVLVGKVDATREVVVRAIDEQENWLPATRDYDHDNEAEISIYTEHPAAQTGPKDSEVIPILRFTADEDAFSDAPPPYESRWRMR